MEKSIIVGRFNQACRAILTVNDTTEDSKQRAAVRSAVLSQTQDLRRWVEEVIGEIQDSNVGRPGGSQGHQA